MTYAPHVEDLGETVTSPGKADDVVGIHVNVDVPSLVEAVHVYPFSDEWFIESIEAVLKAFGYEFPVRRSDNEFNISRNQ